jgi:hypothetical protein
LLGSKRILVGEHILSLASETTPLLLVGEILTLPGSQLVRQGAQLRNKYAHCCGHNPSFAV